MVKKNSTQNKPGLHACTITHHKQYNHTPLRRGTLFRIIQKDTQIEYIPSIRQYIKHKYEKGSQSQKITNAEQATLTKAKEVKTQLKPYSQLKRTT